MSSEIICLLSLSHVDLISLTSYTLNRHSASPCSRREAHPAKHLPPSSMVEQSALNRSIGVRIPGGQPTSYCPESLVSSEDYRLISQVRFGFSDLRQQQF